MQQVDTVILGAGISGLMAAETLRNSNGGSVLLIDKGRSPGGRLATRRIEQGKFDHGAQFITARSSVFKAVVQRWLDLGWVYPWYSNPHPRMHL